MSEPVSAPRPTGGMTTFNMQHGFAESLVRGLRSGFLKDDHYSHLTQCDTLDDFKMNLQETDYDQFLADAAAVTPAIIQVSTRVFYVKGIWWPERPCRRMRLCFAPNQMFVHRAPPRARW